MNQAIYDAEKEDRWWWQRERQSGLSRRDLMRLLAVGTGAAALGTVTYVLIGPDYPAKPVVTTQNVKAAFEVPWGGTVRAGRHTLTGGAWSMA